MRQLAILGCTGSRLFSLNYESSALSVAHGRDIDNFLSIGRSQAPDGSKRLTRCSTGEQDLIVETGQLQALGVAPDRIYIDHGFSGTTGTNRVGLDQALAAVWDGSVFTVTKFDRFARNMAEATHILTDLRRRDVLLGLGPSNGDDARRQDEAPQASRLRELTSITGPQAVAARGPW